MSAIVPETGLATLRRCRSRVARPPRNVVRQMAADLADGRPLRCLHGRATDATRSSRSLVEELGFVDRLTRLHRERIVAGQRPGAFIGELPCRWGSLRLLDVIGRGTYGVVYRARDARTGADLALKLLAGSAAADGGLPSEARCLSRVHHPNVVAGSGVERVGGLIGLRMELLEGPTLEEWLERVGPLAARDVADVGRQVCDGLDAMHRVGLLHGDVKAQNAIRLRDGRVVLMDLGSSVEFRVRTKGVTRTSAGTPLYMAPELLAGGQPSVASDVYATGMLLFRLASGVCAIEGRTCDDLRASVARGRRQRLAALRPGLPFGFTSAVEQAIHPDPARRHRSAAVFGRALARSMRRNDVGAQAPHPGATSARRRAS